jgi:hypothetical protein
MKMRKTLILILFIFPYNSLAADSGLTFGLEEYGTKANTEVEGNRLLWAFSYQ